MARQQQQQTKNGGYRQPPTWADQPDPPQECCKDELKETTPPDDLGDIKKCKHPEENCQCPEAYRDCLQELIDKQKVVAAPAEQANKFKGEIIKIVELARKASQDYTPDKYTSLIAEWVRQDAAIADLIRKLVCSARCWKCVIDCYVCPLLYELEYAERHLYGDRKLYKAVNSLYDLEYWHTRDLAAKERRFYRIKDVLKRWETPCKTIEQTLKDNRSLIDGIGPLLGPQPGKAIYDLFLRLVPTHLAIAPPVEDGWTTKIEKRFTEFCKCVPDDSGSETTPAKQQPPKPDTCFMDDCERDPALGPDLCCGPDLGPWTLRQRLVGPQPYLIKPTEYFKLVCCLVGERYVPAHQAVVEATASLASVEEQIASYKEKFKDGWVKVLETTAKAQIPSIIDCCDYTAAAGDDDDDDHNGGKGGDDNGGKDYGDKDYGDKDAKNKDTYSTVVSALPLGLNQELD